MIASLHAGKFRSLSVSADEGVEEVSADEGVEEFAFRDPAGSSPPFTAGIKDPLLLVVGDFDAVKSWWEQVRTRDEVESKIRVVAEVELQRFAQQVDGLNDEIEAATQRYVGQREEAISAARARTREGVARAAERGEQEARSDSPVGVLAQLLHAPDSFRRSGARKAVEFGMPAKAGSGALPEPADQPRSLQADRKEDLGLDAVGGGGGGAQGAPTAVAKMSRRSVAASRGRQPARLVMQFMARPPGPEPVSDAGLQPVADSAAVGDPADPRPDAVPLPEMEPR